MMFLKDSGVGDRYFRRVGRFDIGKRRKKGVFIEEVFSWVDYEECYII